MWLVNEVISELSEHRIVYICWCNFLSCSSAVPDKPGVPEVSEVKDGAISLTWTIPENDGGAPITNYVLEYRSEGSPTWKKVPDKAISDTKYTVKGLNDKDAYEFHVAAENKAGVGPCSANSSPVKAKEVISKYSIFLSKISYVIR